MGDRKPRAANVGLDAETVGVTGIGQQGLGFGNVLVFGHPVAGHVGQGRRVFHQSRGEESAYYCATSGLAAAVGNVHDVLPVDTQEHGPPHPRIVEGRLVGVDQKPLARDLRAWYENYSALGVLFDLKAIVPAVARAQSLGGGYLSNLE